jgi:Uma2 family endonuclease
MSGSYQEILAGAVVTRNPPGTRHELICKRLHTCVRAGVTDFSSIKLLPPRSEIRLSADTQVCPDLALIAAATGKLWLAAEIISSDDHRADTVIKKEIYEELKLPRLWMIDPRYDNVEVYHGSQYGLVLKLMLAGREILSEALLPEFALNISELFQIADSSG